MAKYGVNELKRIAVWYGRGEFDRGWAFLVGLALDSLNPLNSSQTLSARFQVSFGVFFSLIAKILKQILSFLNP